jgi:hypothetical protein
MSMTRRHMIARGAGLAAAGSAVVLAGCGGTGREERTADRDVDLLQRVLESEATLASVYEIAADQALDPEVAGAVERFGAGIREHIALLGERIAAAGGTPDETPGSPPAAESAVEAIRIALEQSIATAHDVVGGLSTADARRSVYRVMITDSGQLAAIRGVLGEPQVPEAFVTGRPDPPLAVDPASPSNPEGGS